MNSTASTTIQHAHNDTLKLGQTFQIVSYLRRKYFTGLQDHGAAIYEIPLRIDSVILRTRCNYDVGPSEFTEVSVGIDGFVIETLQNGCAVSR